MRTFLLLTSAIVLTCTLRGAEIELTLQTRDPATGKIVLTPERVDPKRVGVIAVDVWNFHWCKTATMRVDAIVPRMNRAPYQAQVTTNLSAVAWQDFGSATGGTSLLITPTNNAAFYRILGQ